MKSTTKRRTRPKPPDDMGEAALLAFHELCDELESMGRLEHTDRAIIATTADTWAAFRAAAAGVTAHGPIIKSSNGVVGESPFAKAQMKYGALLRGLLADLGLTPATRAAEVPPDEDLEI
jgi:P27 family predicted phage terminase small subunit